MPPPLRHRRHDHLIEPFLAGLGSQEAPARPTRGPRRLAGLVLVVLGLSAATWWLVG